MAFQFSDKDQELRLFFYAENGAYQGSEALVIKAHTGLPARSTLHKNPEAVENEVAVYDEEQEVWSVVKDFTGEVFNKQTKQSQNWQEYGELPADLTHLKPGKYDNWDEDSGGWVWDSAAEVADKKASSVSIISSKSTQARSDLVGGLDQYRMAEYADKASLASSLVNGTASAEEKQAALTDAWALENNVTDAAAVGAEWMRKANELRMARNKINKLERDAIAAINRKRTVATVEQELALWKEKIKQGLQELLQQ